MISLGTFAEALMRIEKGRYRKVKNVENRINSMHQALTKVQKEVA